VGGELGASRGTLRGRRDLGWITDGFVSLRELGVAWSFCSEDLGVICGCEVEC
jgi:hypothetical protein